MKTVLVPNVIQGIAKSRIDRNEWCPDCQNCGYVWLTELRGEPVNIAVPCPCCDVGKRHNDFELVYQQSGYSKPFEYVPVDIAVGDRFWSRYVLREAKWQGPNSGTGKRDERRVPGARLVAS